MKLLIRDINACFKNIDDNNVSAILEIKKSGADDFEMIFKYTFSLDKLEKNSVDFYKDIEIAELYNLNLIVKKNPEYKGIFDIYFKVYQNDVKDLRLFAIDKMKNSNILKKEKRKNIFSKMTGETKKFFQELMVEGSTDERNGNIIKVAVYKKICPPENLGEFANRYVIDILRYGTSSWENIYSYEFGEYRNIDKLIDVDRVSTYKVLEQSDLFKVISLLNTEDEYDVIKKYLKTIPKEPYGDEINKEENKIEAIKFL